MVEVLYMGGLIFFAVIGVWFFIVLALIIWLTKKLPEKWWRIPLSFLVFVVFLIFPIVDEIVGGWQFQRLCEANADIQVDRVTAVGKAVYYDSQPAVEIKGKWIRIVLQPWRYVDVESGDVVIAFSTLRASGSFLGKYLAQGAPPLTFNGSCWPKESPKGLRKLLQINVLERGLK